MMARSCESRPAANVVLPAAEGPQMQMIEPSQGTREQFFSSAQGGADANVEPCLPGEQNRAKGFRTDSSLR